VERLCVAETEPCESLSGRKATVFGLTINELTSCYQMVATPQAMHYVEKSESQFA
jgi:hypothetical protein